MLSGDDLEALRSATRPTLLVEPDPGNPGRVALLPGSFDPLTVAHAALAAAARQWADVVILVYSVRTVPKDVDAEPPLLAEPERIKALRRFCAARGTVLGFSSHGLLVEQIQAAASRFPGAELALVVGSDKVLQLFDPGWYEDRDAVLEELFGRCTVLYATRTGEDEALRAVLTDPGNTRWAARLRQIRVVPDVAAVSSRTVRARHRRGEDVSSLLPPSVHLPPGGDGHP